MFQILLGKKRLWAKKLPHSKRRRTTLPKSHSSSPLAELPQSSNSPLAELLHSLNSPLAELFCHEAMGMLAFVTTVVETDITVSANELLSFLYGFANKDSVSVSEFHGRVRRALEEKLFYISVFHMWRKYPAMVEGLSKFSMKCAPEKRVAAMVQDPAFLHILEATKSDNHPCDYAFLDNDYAAMRMRGLLSILYVYWNEDDVEKMLLYRNLGNNSTKREISHDEDQYEG